MPSLTSLDHVYCDLVIAGTGVPQSLLALACSRDRCRLPHIDKNAYYGGAEAALSLIEAEAWAEANHEDATRSPFHCAAVESPEEFTAPKGPASGSTPSQSASSLARSSAYALSLSPQICYPRSKFLSALVSARLDKKLAFLPVGNWYIFDPGNDEDLSLNEAVQQLALDPGGRLRKIPSSREDVVHDSSIDNRSKRNLKRALELCTDAERLDAAVSQHGSQPLPDFLRMQFNLDPKLHAPFLALTLTPDIPVRTTTAYALPRLHRHLTSMNAFGPSINAIIPKYGGLGEIAQQCCRALAVGGGESEGGLYVLNKSLEEIKAESVGGEQATEQGWEENMSDEGDYERIVLSDGEEIKSRKVVGSQYDLPSPPQTSNDDSSTFAARTISIISSPLTHLFPSPSEGAPAPAVAIVVCPSSSLSDSDPPHPPIYLQIRSSDSAECPRGQSIIYAHLTTAGPASTASRSLPLLDAAISALLSAQTSGRASHGGSFAKEDKKAAGDETNHSPSPTILWRMRYLHAYPPSAPPPPPPLPSHSQNVSILPAIPPTFVLEDDIVDEVQQVWESLDLDQSGKQKQMGGFCVFDELEGQGG